MVSKSTLSPLNVFLCYQDKMWRDRYGHRVVRTSEHIKFDLFGSPIKSQYFRLALGVTIKGQYFCCVFVLLGGAEARQLHSQLVKLCHEGSHAVKCVLSISITMQ